MFEWSGKQNDLTGPSLKYNTKKFGKIARFRLTNKLFIKTWTYMIICIPDITLAVLTLTTTLCTTTQLEPDRDECLYLIFRISQFLLRLRDRKFLNDRIDKKFEIDCKKSYIPHISHNLYLHVKKWIDIYMNHKEGHPFKISDKNFSEILTQLQTRLDNIYLPCNINDISHFSNDETAAVTGGNILTQNINKRL